MKTTKVRIAVRVNAKGDWCASGWRDASDESMREVTAGVADDWPLDAAERIVYVEADVPLPQLEESVVEGRAIDD